MYSLSNLKETVLDFIEKNTQEVFRTESFHELSEEAFGVLLSSDKLNIDEIDLISLFREWATVNSVSNFFHKLHIHHYIACTPYSLVNLYFAQNALHFTVTLGYVV